MQAVLLRPLPFPEQERIVVAWKQDASIHNPFIELSVAEIKDWQAQSQSFTGLAAMPTTVYGYGYVLTGRGEPLQLESAKVTGRFFSILGARAALGRVFDETDDRLNGANVVVLSDHLWRGQFNADPEHHRPDDYVGSHWFHCSRCDACQFCFPKGVDLWVPLLTAVSATSY